MGKTIKYALLTCAVAYFLAAVIVFILTISQNGWGWLDRDSGRVMVSALTLALSEFGWWGDFYYLAVLVPWLGSSLLLVLLLAWSRGRVKPGLLLGGISVGVYYLAMFLAFITAGLVGGWGDIAYPLLIIWPVAGFGLGCLSAWIADKIVKLPVYA